MTFDKKTLRNIFLGVISCIILYWVLFDTERVKSVLTVVKRVCSPFIIGSVMAFILNVPMRGIERIMPKVKNDKFRRVIALVLTFVAILLVFSLVLYLLIPQVIDTARTFAASLPPFFESIQNKIIIFLNERPQLMQWVSENVGLEMFDFAALIQKAINWISSSVSTIVSGTFTAIGTASTALINIVIGIVFALYCLFNKESLSSQGRKILYAFLPEKWCDHTVRILRLTNTTFSNFLSGQCLEVVILGCLFAISMAIFRMPYIPLVSVLVAVTAFIPVVGAFAGCILGALFILVNDPIQAVWFVIMFLVIQQIENNIIYPRVVGTSIGLPGMWVLVAVAIGGELMGVAGMFLMIPLVSVLYTIFREVVMFKLSKRDIEEDKLQAQPLEYKSHLKIQGEKLWKKISSWFKKKK